MRDVVERFKELIQVSGLQWRRDAAQGCTDFLAAFVLLPDFHNSFSESALKQHREQHCQQPQLILW